MDTGFWRKMLNTTPCEAIKMSVGTTSKGQGRAGADDVWVAGDSFRPSRCGLVAHTYANEAQPAPPPFTPLLLRWTGVLFCLVVSISCYLGRGV